MQRRLHRYQVDGQWRTIWLLNDERFDRAFETRLNPMSRVSAMRSLVAMAGLPNGTPANRLGEAGPVVASRANLENEGDPTLGIYDSMFGRDSLRIAAMLASFRPVLERQTILYWAERQGTLVDERTQELPGRIAHEYRDPNDPQRKLNEARGINYPDFGSLDATPLWLVAVCRQARRNPSFLNTVVQHERGHSASVASAVRAAVDLVDSWRSENSEGLIESEAYAGTYKAFPVWKDSPDAYHHHDGTLATPKVASIEVMGYAYAAYAQLARLATDHPDLGLDSGRLEAAAAEVKEAIFEHFWMDDLGYFALGTDRSGPGDGVRPLAVRASNMGYLLSSGVLDDDGGERDLAEVREKVIEALFDQTMLCPAGIRTLAKDEVRFRENGYHVGAVWPMDTYAIAEGLLRSGPDQRFGGRGSYPRLAKVLFDCVARDCREYLPEFMPGSDDPNPKPGNVTVRVDAVNCYGDPINRSAEKVPQPMQGWTAAAFAAVKMGAKELQGAVRRQDPNSREANFENAMLGQLAERGFAANHSQDLQLGSSL